MTFKWFHLVRFYFCFVQTNYRSLYNEAHLGAINYLSIGDSEETQVLSTFVIAQLVGFSNLLTSRFRHVFAFDLKTVD